MSIEKKKMEDRIFASKISAHKRLKKELIPPMAELNLELSSWFNKRLPEMLWAVLVVGSVDRKTALEFFRHVAGYVSKNQHCYDIRLTSISKLKSIDKENLIKFMTRWSDEIKIALNPLIFFTDLPAYSVWEKFLDEPEYENDWIKLTYSVQKAFWHQSIEATDCRWVRILCWIASGQFHCKANTMKEYCNYPNYGETGKVRGSIRAAENALEISSKDKESYEWPQKFWKHCFDKTICLPEEAMDERVVNKKTNLNNEIKAYRIQRNKMFASAWRETRLHCIDTCETTAVDSRHEGAFGIALYGLTLFAEIISYRTQIAILGRLALRSLVEAYITFRYLLHKEQNDPDIWNAYRQYGRGQLKLIYLKLIEPNHGISSIETDKLEYFVNEDKWVEFVPIDLGHWDSTNLRSISEDVGLKEIYDRYYDYTSGHTHISWGAIREAVYQVCKHPLHRFHRVPTYEWGFTASVVADAQGIMNNIFECLSEAYPKFDFRFTDPDPNGVITQNHRNQRIPTNHQLRMSKIKRRHWQR